MFFRVGRNQEPSRRTRLQAIPVLACLSVGLLLLPGCGGTDVELVPMSGEVYDASEPMEGALVQFKPESGRSSFSRVESDGTFTMKYKPGVPGVVPGKHRVMVTPKDAMENTNPTYSGPAGNASSVTDENGDKVTERTMSGGPKVEEVDPKFYWPDVIIIEPGSNPEPLIMDVSVLRGG